MEDTMSEENAKGGFPVTDDEKENVESVSSVDHSMRIKSGGLASRNESDAVEKSPNTSEKFGEKTEVRINPLTEANESLQNDEQTNEFGSGVCMEAEVSEENSETFGKPDADLIEEQAMPSLGMSGMKRKAETSMCTNNEEAVCLTPKLEESENKWYCSLCGVSTTSEGTLNHHMQGKKHKAKEEKSKLHGIVTINSMDCYSSTHLHLQQMGHTDSPSLEEKQTPATNKWYCSLCQVSTSSETLFKSHLMGKKHKAKEARLGIYHENVQTEVMMKWYCSLCEVSVASEKDLQEHFLGKKHKAKEEGQDPLENEQKKGENCENELEMKGSKLENSTDGEGNQELRLEFSKCWHCKMCNQVTHDEESMDAHRKGDKHREALMANRGGVIVVSTILAKGK